MYVLASPRSWKDVLGGLIDLIANLGSPGATHQNSPLIQRDWREGRQPVLVDQRPRISLASPLAAVRLRIGPLFHVVQGGEPVPRVDGDSGRAASPI